MPLKPEPEQTVEEMLDDLCDQVMADLHDITLEYLDSVGERVREALEDAMYLGEETDDDEEYDEVDPYGLD